MDVIGYVAEEVERQGHDVYTLDGIERVGWMLNAWTYALKHARTPPTIHDVRRLGKIIGKAFRTAALRWQATAARSATVAAAWS